MPGGLLQRKGELNGQVRQFISEDGGKSWRPIPEQPAPDASGEVALTDSAPNLGVTDGAGPKVSTVLKGGGTPPPAAAPATPPVIDSPLAKLKAGIGAEGAGALDAAKGNAPPPTQAPAAPGPMGGLAAFTTMLPHGLMSGWNEEQAQAAHGSSTPGMEGLSLPTEQTPTIDPSNSFEIERAQQKAQHDSPKSALAGQLVGGGVGSIPLTALMGMIPGMAALTAEGAPLVSKMASGGIQGGVAGGIAGAGEAPPGQGLEGAKRGIEAGSTIGAMVPAAFAAPGVSHLMSWLGDTLESQGSRQRGLSSGPNKGQIDAMKDMKGPDAVAGLGRDMEASGYGGPGSPGVFPKSYQGTEEASHAALGTVGKKVEALATRADQQGITVDMRPVAMAMEDEATRLKGLGLPEADRAADALRSKVDTIIGNTDKGIDPNQDRGYIDAWEYRKFLDDMAFDAEGQKAGADAKRLRGIAGEVRKAMRAAAGEDPELASAIETANKEYETTSRVYNNAKGAASHEESSDNPKSPMVSRGRGRALAARALREGENLVKQAPNYTPAAMGAMSAPWLFDPNQQ